MKRCRTRIFQAVATVVAKVLKWVQAKGIMPQEQQEVKPGYKDKKAERQKNK